MYLQEAFGKLSHHPNNQVVMYKYLILFLFLFSCKPQQEITTDKCEEGLVFQIKSNLPLSTKLYNCELINDETEEVIQGFQSMINQFVKVDNLNKNQRVKLRIKDIASDNSAVSKVVESCNSELQEIDVTGFFTPVSPVIGEVKVTLLFPCAEIDAKKLPALELYSRFRVSGTLQWKDLPVLKYSTEGKNYFSISTKLLKVGETYDFQVGAAPGYYSFSEVNQKIVSEDWVILIGTELFCK